MARLCERPGCSDDAAVAYRFDAAERWVRLDVPDDDDRSAGALCTRHADSMMVPRGWTLDDRRDAVPRLFRLPPPDPPGRDHAGPEVAGDTEPASRARRWSRRQAADEVSVPQEGHQLSLDEGEVTVLGITERPTPPPGDEPIDPDATTALPWAPVFDDTDDLDGTLAADGELLDRAFRGNARRRA